MKLIVGLQNPPSEYANTRHNIGGAIVDELAKSLHITLESNTKFSAIFGNNDEVMIALPDTYMNESGIAVANLAGFYKIVPEDIWIVHDDLDIPLGEFKTKQGGSSAGHNGIKSVEEKLGTPNFNRFRIGISSNRDMEHPIPAEDYVLQKFTSEEQGVLDSKMSGFVSELHKII